MNSTSESLLIRLKSDSHSEAWARFVELYPPLIFYWGRKVGLQSNDASDLVQDVLTIVYQKLPSWNYDPKRTFRGWLRTVTLNRHRELGRKKKIDTTNPSPSFLGKLPDDETAQSTWDVNYARQLVATAMEMMKPDFAPKTWAALKVLITSGRPAADISRESGVSVWTLYSAKNRLMARLRTELDGLLE